MTRKVPMRSPGRITTILLACAMQTACLLPAMPGAAAAAVQGDVNEDGELDVTDLAAMQKWLLAVPGTRLQAPGAGDLNGDGVLDIFDLGLMKQALLRQGSPIVYQTEAAGIPVVNPHKGYMMTTYSPFMFSEGYQYGIGGSLHNQAWELVSVCAGAHYWKDVNPAEGVYDWTAIDEMLETCAAHGMTYVIRIIPYSTSIGSDADFGKAHDLVPDYVYTNGAGHVHATLRSDASVQLRVPDWSDPSYLRACKDFAAALAERYDGDPRVEFIDVRTFGNWGEWHTSQLVGSEMPSEAIQTDMLDHYAAVFRKTQLTVPSDASGDVYRHALSLGITKRNDGLIAIPGRDKDLVPAYEANLPTIAEYPSSYASMLNNTDIIPGGYLRWTPERFRSAIETAHMTMMALDQPSDCGYQIYSEQREVLEEMVNRMGYNFTVTSAVRRGDVLEVTVKNTGLAPAFFDIDLAAELTDASGRRIVSLGEPVRILRGSFRDGTEQQFTFCSADPLPGDAVLCLAMYEPDGLSAGTPSVRFDNRNTLENGRLLLVKE